MSDENKKWLSPGSANTGHENLICSDCHRESDGTTRQQIQANVKHSLGLRKHDVNFQLNPVTNEQCLDCHDRENDKHPVQRFNEPRFAEVRKKLHPELCVSCHKEHQGKRVTLEDIGYCKECHDKFSIKHDSISVPHQNIVILNAWQTCLGCHDFHGNHEIKLLTDVNKVISADEIQNHFDGKSSIYSKNVIHKAKEKLNEK